MRRMPMLAVHVAALFLVVAAVAGAQQPSTPGQVRPRPAEGRDPEFPLPDIREYKPRSTLVVSTASGAATPSFPWSTSTAIRPR